MQTEERPREEQDVNDVASQWTYEDGPEAHPMWEEEVNLEHGMMRSGAAKVRDKVIEAEARGEMTKLSPVRGLVEEWLPQVALGVKEWLRSVDRSRGPKPIAYPYIREIDPYASALITVRAILNGIADARQGLVALAMEIGHTVEYEQRVRLWEKAEPDLFHAVKQEMDKNHSTATHRRRVNINRFNHLRKTKQVDTLEWEDWPQEVVFRVGVTLVDVVVRVTGWFELANDPEHHYRKGSKQRPQLVLVVKPGIQEWLYERLLRQEETHPDRRPMVVPPKRWTNSRDGGYWTPYVMAPRLVRFRASQETQRARAADEYDAIDMPEVYDALHLLQETPWRVNTRVLEVLEQLWDGNAVAAGLPERAERHLPARTPRMHEHREAQKQAKASHEEPPEPDAETAVEIARWRRAASEVHRFNNKRFGRLRSIQETLKIARHYRGYEAFYFPHMLDFRGRFYPIPAFLQPQGNDIARGLLTFADAMPITEENSGADWLALQVATMWGHDKVSFEERVAWVEEQEALWRRIAADPIGSMEWTDADKPFQVLAAIFEWVAYLDSEGEFYSSLPCMVDGTCNGIQHLAALTRDAVTGEQVNLVPGEKPKDIYRFVAVALQRKLEADLCEEPEVAAMAKWWIDLCGGNLPRTLTKRQVMVVPYGGSKDAFFKYTRKWLDEAHPVDYELASKEELQARNEALKYLVGHLWQTVHETVSGGVTVMKWLQDCAKPAAEANQPVYWITPSGFVVRHFYGLEKTSQCKLLLDGEKYQVVVAERTDRMSVKDQLQGISPNFIHSLDAAALVRCLTLGRKAGLTAFTSIHDAYGTHAANMWPLFRLLREGFVEVHREDVLREFRTGCVRVLVAWLVAEKGLDQATALEQAEDMIPPEPLKGALDLEGVLDSDYFFA